MPKNIEAPAGCCKNCVNLACYTQENNPNRRYMKNLETGNEVDAPPIAACLVLIGAITEENLYDRVGWGSLRATAPKTKDAVVPKTETSAS